MKSSRQLTSDVVAKGFDTIHTTHLKLRTAELRTQIRFVVAIDGVTIDLQKMNDLLYRLYGKFLLLISCSLVMSCSENEQSYNHQLHIVATTGMIGDAIKNIVKDSADVVTLMGPGVDPHLYKATRGDSKKLNEADVIFYNGLHLEGKMTEVFKKLSKVKSVYAVSDSINQSKLIADPRFPTGVDPHIWFDVRLWIEAVQYISEVLQKKDTIHATYYQQNTHTYLQQLDSLHTAVKAAIQKIPKAQRVLVTAHDAFGYFGNAYDIEVRGLQGVSTVSEFGLKDVVDLVEFIIDRNIKAIFVETSVPAKPLKAVIEGCKKRGYRVVIGGNLYSDAMGEAATLGGTYIGMVCSNVQTITNALE